MFVNILKCFLKVSNVLHCFIPFGKPFQITGPLKAKEFLKLSRGVCETYALFLFTDQSISKFNLHGDFIR